MSLPRVDMVRLDPSGEWWEACHFSGRWAYGAEAREIQTAYRLAEIPLPPDCAIFQMGPPEEPSRSPGVSFESKPAGEPFYVTPEGNIPEHEYRRRFPDGMYFRPPWMKKKRRRRKR